MLYAGLDVHKNFCQAIIMTKDGETVKEDRFKTEKEDIENFFINSGDLSIAFEASSNYEYFYDLLTNLGHKVYLSHPLKTKLIAESKVKTDKIDAKILANLLRANLLPTSYVPPVEIRKLRHLVRHRIFLVRHRARIKNQIHAELSRGNLKFSGSKLFTLQGINWLKELSMPAVDSYLTIHDIITKEIKSIDLDIKIEGMNYQEVRLLITIPGIGIFSALLIFSEIGDVNRFPFEDKLFSYSGLIPGVHQSGDTNYNRRITKEGSKYLRWILTEAVRVHIRFAPDSKITKYYHRLKKKKPENKAIIATARKLLQVIYHMLKNNAEFVG